MTGKMVEDDGVNAGNPGKAAQKNIRDIYHRLFRGGTWMLAARGCSTMLGVCVYVMLARLLTPTELGSYFLTVSVVACGAILGSLGLNEATIRFIGESLGKNDLGRARHAIIRTLQLGVFGAILVAFLYLALGDLLATRAFHQVLMAAAIGLTGVWIGLAALQANLSNVFRGLQQFHLCALFTGPPGLITAGALSVSLLIVLVTTHECGFRTAIWLSVGSAAFASVLGTALLVSRVPADRNATSNSLTWTTILNVAWPLLITDVLLYVISQTDLWIVGGFRSAVDVAIYGAAWRLAVLVAVPLAVTNAILPPFIAQLHAQGDEVNLEKLLRRFATLGGIPAITACLAAVLFGRPILAIVYGKFYSSGWVVLAALSVGQAANVLAGSCGFTLIMTGHERTMMAITGLSGLTFAACEALVVGPFGIEGVACVAAGAMILQNLLMLLFTKKQVGLWTHTELVKRIIELRMSSANG